MEGSEILGMSFQDLKKKTSLDDSIKGGIIETRAFLKGDHWQGGSGWIGIQPSVLNREITAFFENIQVSFTSKNLIKEIVRRLKNAVLSREPDFNLVSKSKKKKRKSRTAKTKTQRWRISSK